MRLRSTMPRTLLVFLLMSVGAQARADVAYAIGDGGASLIRFDTSSPGSATRVGFFAGDDTFLDAIDFRPATGELYGYRDATDSYFVVDVATGELRSATGSPVGATTNTFFLGMDWNPTIDRMRVVTESGQNLVYNPNTGTAAAFTPLFYAAGDVNAGLAPLVIENAYTNNITGLGLGTQQFVLDHGLNVLATLANNAGTLQTVGEITLNGIALDFDEYAGFDIFTRPNGDDIAYAILTVSGAAGLYRIDLASGEATSLGSIGGGFGPVYSLAIVPVPEPSSLVLMGLGVGGLLGAVIRRRRRV